MGWLWSSSSSAPISPSSPSPLSSSSTQQPSFSPSQPQHQAHARDNDPELQQFLDLLASDSQSSTSSTPSTSSTSPSSQSNPPSVLSTWLSSKLKSPPPPPPPPKLSSVSESLLPTEMSCRQAFDLAWSCNSLGGQWNAVYRRGTMRSCSAQWDAFWFCMRSKSYTTGVKEDAIREHYRRLEYEKYYAPGRQSSEDVWEARREKVQPGTAFIEPIDLPQVSDDEWRSMEEEKRKKVRKDLGF